MKRSALLFFPFLLFLAVLLAPLRSDEGAQPTSKPPLWLMPPTAVDHGNRFRELFTHPDQWTQTRSKIAGVGLADLQLSHFFSDDELRRWSKMLANWNLKMCVESGAVKPQSPTGEKSFALARPHWDRYIALGGKLDVVAMDEPLICTRFFLHKPDDYAVQQTADFIQLVRQNYPGTKIGDIEGYPSIGSADLMRWIDALQARLASMHVKGLDFFRADADWDNFVLDTHKGSWPDLVKLEHFCRSRHLPFSLIYWAADIPALEKTGHATAATWYISTMQMGNDYAIAGGNPNEYVLESWVGEPPQSVPESLPWTFTGTALDFANTFLK